MFPRIVALGLVLLAIAPAPALAEPPFVVADQGPFGGKYFFDPILYYGVAYTEAGHTDCMTPAVNQCHVRGPGQDAKWVRVVIEGKGSASFDLSNEVTKVDLLTESCGSTGAFAQCIFRLQPEQSSTDFHLQVYRTDGVAGTAIYVYLESGSTLFGQML